MKQLRFLVVEDEPLVAMLHEDMIGLAGHVVVSTPYSYDEAVGAAEAEDFDVALLDAELWGRGADSVVAALISRNKSTIVCSGHAPSCLPHALKGLTTLSKPYMLADFTALLNDLHAAA